MQFFAAFVFIAIFTANQAHAAEPTYIPASMEDVGGDTINDLKWNDEGTRIRIETLDKEVRYVAILAGTYIRDGWELKRSDKLIKRNAIGGFIYEAVITKKARAFEFVATGPEGKMEKGKFVLQVPLWQEEEAAAKNPPKPEVKRLFVLPGLGLSFISTKETQISDYSTTALTAKLGANYLIIPGKFDAGVTTYFTALQLSKSDPAISARYWGFNLRAGYTLPFVEVPWQATIYGGWYYTTTFVTNNAFGYKNLSGPQIYPTVRRGLPNGDVISAYFKFSPIASSLKLLTLSNREIAFGTAYIHPLGNGHIIAGTFDFSTFTVTFNGITSQTNSLTFGVQYGL